MHISNAKIVGIAIASVLAVTTAAFAAPPGKQQSRPDMMQSGRMMQGNAMHAKMTMGNGHMMPMMGRMKKMMARCGAMMEMMDARMSDSHQPKPAQGKGG